MQFDSDPTTRVILIRLMTSCMGLHADQHYPIEEHANCRAKMKGPLLYAWGRCYRHADEQVDGLVPFGTQPSSHVTGRMSISAWLEPYIRVKTSLVMTNLESLSHSIGVLINDIA